MADTRWRKVWRDAWLSRARTMLVALALATGLAGAGTVLDAWALVRRATLTGFAASNPVDATLHVDPLDAAILPRLHAIAGVGDVELRRTVTAQVQAGGSWRPASLFVVDDPAAQRIGRLALAAGAWPGQAVSLAIEHSSVEFAGATLGDSVLLALPSGGSRAVPVTGIVRDVGLAPGWMEHVVYAFVTPATMRALGLPAAPTEVRLTAADGAATQEAVRRVAFAVKAAIEGVGGHVRDVDVPVPGEHIHAPQMDSLLFTQGAFGLLALLTCAFLVVNLVGAMLAGQSREIGVMKTLGAQPRQLAAMYLGWAAGLGGLASAIAIPVAWQLGQAYGRVKADLLNFDLTGVPMPAWALALQVVVGLLLPVAAAAIPVRRAARAPVATALRDVGLHADAPGRETPGLARVGGVSRVLLLSMRNAFRRRTRMALTMLALATGGAVFLGARDLRASVIGSVDLLFGAQRYDVSLRLGEAHDAAAAERVARAVPGVEDVEGWTGARAVARFPDGTAGTPFAITAMPAASRLYRPTMRDGRWLQPGEDRALVVSRALLRQSPELAAARRVALEVGGTVAEWTVVGIADGGPAPAAWTSVDALANITGDPRVTTLMVATPIEGIASQVDLIQRLRAGLGAAGMPVAGSTRIEESRRVTEDHLLMVVDFLAVMGWIMIAVGGMGLASTMGLAVLERTREIGVMRAIGARHRALITIVEVEGLVIALLAWLVAIPVSIPMSVALGVAFGRVMFPVPLRLLPAWEGVGIWFAVATITSGLACLWPALRATRRPVAAALAYE